MKNYSIYGDINVAVFEKTAKKGDILLSNDEIVRMMKRENPHFEQVKFDDTDFTFTIHDDESVMITKLLAFMKDRSEKTMKKKSKLLAKAFRREAKLTDVMGETFFHDAMRKDLFTNPEKDKIWFCGFQDDLGFKKNNVKFIFKGKITSQSQNNKLYYKVDVHPIFMKKDSEYARMSIALFCAIKRRFTESFKEAIKNLTK